MTGTGRNAQRWLRPSGPLGSVALALVASLFSVGLAEALARATGHQPYRPTVPPFHIEPGGRLQVSDPVLGFTYPPGRFRIAFANGDTWTATHRPDTLRITRPVESYDRPWDGPSIWLFGCSFVHGWGLEDRETLGFRLHERMPGFDVVNFGVGSYSTVQSLLQFRAALGHRPPPAYAVLAYAGFHDERNTVLRHWRRGTYEYQGLGTAASPYARLDGHGGLTFHFDQPRYTGFWLIRHSAFFELVDQAYMRLEECLLQSHRVSELLVDEFARAAADRKVRFVLAGISREPETRRMLAYARQRGLAAVDASVPLVGRNRIAFDGHPSERANRLSSALLADFLRGLEAEGRAAAGGRAQAAR